MATRPISKNDYQSEWDADTLAKAEEIKADRPRLKRAITKAKGLKTQKEKELRNIKKISSKKVPQ